MLLNTRIISAFPGVGKSHFSTQFGKTIGSKKIQDSDSSLFSWYHDEWGEKKRNPDFPQNYINHIKSNIGKQDYILVSTHEEVRKALLENNINYEIVFPAHELKAEYLKRYEYRNSPLSFIDLMDKAFDRFITELTAFCLSNNIKYTIIKEPNVYLADII